MSRKTSGALQIQLQTVVKAMEEAISKLIEKVDTLAGKIDKMPNVAKKMTDSYVASFGTIAKSVEGLASHVNKLDKIGSGLTNIANAAKGFKATEGQAAAFDRLARSFSVLGPAVGNFPKDVSGLTAFADTIGSISTAMSGLEGKIPGNAQIDRLNRAANAIRNAGNALKSVGAIPPDAMAMFQSMNRGGGPPPTGPGGGGGGTGGGTPPESSDFKQYAAKGIGVAVSFGVTEALKRQNVNKELSQVMAFENSTLGSLIPGADQEFRSDSAYTAQIKQGIAAQQIRHGVNYEDVASTLAMTARYTAGGNRAYGDVRTLAPGERIDQQSNLIGNSKQMFQATGLDMSSAANMQLFMGRDLGIKAEEYSKVKDAFIQVQRAGALTARDLEKLSSNARDSGMALNLVGDEAAAYITERMKSATALATAGIKASDTQGAMAGFFGDEGSFIFDMLAGITDADYKKGNEANLLKKQYAAMGGLAAGMGNDREGNFRLQAMIGMGVHPASITSAEQYRTVSGRLDDVSMQQERLDILVAENRAVSASTTMMEDLSIVGQRVVGVFGGIAAAFGYANSAGQKAVPPGTPGAEQTSRPDMVSAFLWSNPLTIGHMAAVKAVNYIRGGEKPAGYATGGVVKPGASGATDSVPIMATPGEEVLSKSDPRHSSNNFMRSFAQIEGYYAKGDKPNRPQRNLNPGNLRVYGWSSKMDPSVALEHARTQGAIGYDPGGYLKFGSEAAGFAGLQRQINIDAKRGLDVGSFIEKYAPANENNTENYKAFIKSKGFAGSTPLASITGGGSSAPALADGISSVFTGLTGLMASQKAQQQAPVQLDPAVMGMLSDIANSNSGSSDTMAQAVGMFAQVIQRLVSGSRSGGSSGQDLTESVARGNYAFSRGV